MARRFRLTACLATGLLAGLAASCGGSTQVPDPGTRDVLPDDPGPHGETPPVDIVDVVFPRDDAGPGEDEGGIDTSMPLDIQPGQFGAPCVTNTDCDTSFCLEGTEGFVCTRSCVEACPDGWACRGILVGQDMLSLCVQLGATICKPCRMDAQCGDGLCLDIAGGKFCGKDCTDRPCPEGYRCADVPAGGDATARQCLPKSNACDCGPATKGTQKPCVRQNASGTCLGFETCDGDLGWVDCTALTPAPETCNGIDDDCNGVADDSPRFPDGTCHNEVPDLGACPGAWVCKGEEGWDCVGPQPQPETCDYEDDDCDGTTDEDFTDAAGGFTKPANCGACGNDCASRIPFSKEVACDATKGVPACVVVSCEAGYYKAAENRCMPQISSLCVPCVDDASCGGAGDKCLTLGGGTFCGRDCSTGSVSGTACPTGFACKDAGAGLRQCQPDSGSCGCMAGNAGMHRMCQETSEWGTCYGTETCDPAQGFVDCTARLPSREVCNGLDDDCDGIADDAPVPPVEPCQKTWTDPGTGQAHACTADWECSDAGTGTRWSCNAKQPAAEACNYQDDDCDGATDEDFKAPGTSKYADLDHCGACGVSCRGLVPHATMTCDASGARARCVVASCDAGWWKASDLSCAEFPETLCTACASDRACQVPGDACLNPGADEGASCLWDCSPSTLHPETVPGEGVCPDGYLCQARDGAGKPLNKCVPTSGSCGCLAADAGRQRVCAASNALGTCPGVETCNPAKGWEGCTALPPAAETCNGRDDDCDGLVDEAWADLGTACFAGTGECRAMGTVRCAAGGAGTECGAVAGTAATETCDGLDNDCDGTADEDWPDKGKVCLAGVGECRRAGTYSCAAGGAGLACDATPGPKATEACDLLDNDCDGEVDEDFRTGSVYGRDTACGNCFTDCTRIYALPHATGTCSTAAATPVCQMACDATFYDLNRVPNDGCEFGLDATAVVVSGGDAAAVDDGTCGLGPTGTGAANHPCRTIGTGIARAMALARTKVLVADGLYEETVTLAGGVSLLGGYRADTWERHLASTLSTLRGTGTSTHLRTVLADSITQATVFEGFVVYGPINATAGGNSYAIQVRDSTSALSIRDNLVYGGSGGPGANGTNGASGGAGVKGGVGSAAKEITPSCKENCTTGMETAGGAGGVQACEGADDVSGGDGGRGVCPDYNTSVNECTTCATVEKQTIDARSTGGRGGNSGGPGGSGGYHAQIDYDCNGDCGCYVPAGEQIGRNGTDGSNGTKGARGTGCATSTGTVAGGEWQGGAGADGTDGTHGRGGGGGGAGGGVETVKDASSCASDGASDIGGSGGGGGSGGCRGRAGTGGTAGGGAFDLFVVFTSAPASVPVVTGNTFRRGFGGAGGQGGYGGTGGPGGAGANGGISGAVNDTTYCAAAGGKGGTGGDGGHGGGGGGGCGGAAYGIYSSNTAAAGLAAWKTGNTFPGGGAGGQGGAGGGSMGDAGSDGTAGTAANANF